MDEIVARSLAKWPNVPAVYGWLELDRRGNWLIKGERIGNVALREFIARNYDADERGRWFFQNGPQRVSSGSPTRRSSCTTRASACSTTAGEPVEALEDFPRRRGLGADRGERGIGLLDDRDLERYADIGRAAAAHRARRGRKALRLRRRPPKTDPPIPCVGVIYLFIIRPLFWVGAAYGELQTGPPISFLETLKTCPRSTS